jgi:hypothetical protein
MIIQFFYGRPQKSEEGAVTEDLPYQASDLLNDATKDRLLRNPND